MINMILRLALGLADTVIESMRLEGGDLVLGVRPHKRRQRRCPVCGRKGDYYDMGPAPRRWRASDIARLICHLEYRPARVRCPEHGVHVEQVPWARHKARFTRDFEDRVAWMAVHCTAKATAAECRIEWHTVGGICRRVYDELLAAGGPDRYAGLRRIGIDETSYRKGQKYITVVVDHDLGCVVWAAEGYGKEVLDAFFKELTPWQRQQIELASADGAKWIKALVKKRCKNARVVMDPFHVVSWMNDALDGVRRDEWRVAKAAADAAVPKRSRPGRPSKGDETPPEAKALRELADEMRGSRYALLKRPEDLTDKQREALARVEQAGSHLFKAWELKEDLRAVFRAETAGDARALLDDWLYRASYCRIPRVVKVEQKVRKRREDIIAAVECGISNAAVEAINNKIKVTIKMAYGFRNTDNMISLIMLRCSSVTPQLPGHKPEPTAGERKAAADEKRAKNKAKRKENAA